MPFDIPVASLALLGCILLLARYLIYPALFGPLSSVPPAHPLASFTHLWILYIRYTRHENKAIQAAHASKGPVVRLSPSEISVNFVEGGVRTVYGASFGKHEWYKIFANYDILNAFSTLDAKAHSLRKRRITHVYSKPFLLSPESGLAPISHTIIHDRLLPILDEAAEKGNAIDVLELFFSTAMDFITAYQLGLPSSTNFLQNVDERRHWLDIYQCRRPYSFWGLHASRLKSFLHRVGMRVVPEFVAKANEEMERYVLRLVQRTEERVESGFVDEESKEAMVYRALRRGMEKEEEKLAREVQSAEDRRLEIASELLDELAAGHETAAIALTFLAYHLSIKSSIQDRLRVEIMSTALDQNPESLDTKTIDALPFLEACLLETLRLNAPIPGPQPRTPTSPSQLSLGVGGQTVIIPPDTRVSAQAYSLHRNPDVFPDPERWDPERWLIDESAPREDEEERLKEMHRWFWAFGSGGRMCFGSNFALLEMKTLVATIWSRYRTELADIEEKILPAKLEQEDGYTVGPVGGRLDLHFIKV